MSYVRLYIRFKLFFLLFSSPLLCFFYLVQSSNISEFGGICIHIVGVICLFVVPMRILNHGRGFPKLWLAAYIFVLQLLLSLKIGQTPRIHYTIVSLLRFILWMRYAVPSFHKKIQPAKYSNRRRNFGLLIRVKTMQIFFSGWPFKSTTLIDHLFSNSDPLLKILSFLFEISKHLQKKKTQKKDKTIQILIIRSHWKQW